MTQPQPPYPPPIPPQLPPPKKRHTGLIILGVVGVLIVILFGSCVAGLAGGGGEAPSQGQPAKQAPAEKKPEKVVFKVTGDGKADIIYGTDSDDRSGNEHTDSLGTPYTKPPWKESLKLRDNVSYYHLTAQLLGNGDITCKIVIGGKTIDRGHAEGDYNICEAQIAPGIIDEWEPVE